MAQQESPLPRANRLTRSQREALQRLAEGWVLIEPPLAFVELGHKLRREAQDGTLGDWGCIPGATTAWLKRLRLVETTLAAPTMTGEIRWKLSAQGQALAAALQPAHRTEEAPVRTQDTPPVITRVWFDAPPMGQTTATATMSDDTTVELFGFYPDEIRFTEAELIGKTAAEAAALRRQRDISYLQSE